MFSEYHTGMNYYYMRNGDIHGPVSPSELGHLFKRGEIEANTQICAEGEENWRLFSEVPATEQSEQLPIATLALPPVMVQPAPLHFPDTIFFNELGVMVSKTRFVIGSQTFAVSGITSVDGIELAPNRTGPIVLLIAGLLFLVVYIGIIMVIGAIIWFVKQKSVFAVTLTTAGSQVMVYQSPNRIFISRIIAALNNAIVARG